jgi:hypothetical protein
MKIRLIRPTAILTKTTKIHEADDNDDTREFYTLIGNSNPPGVHQSHYQAWYTSHHVHPHRIHQTFRKPYHSIQKATHIVVQYMKKVVHDA